MIEEIALLTPEYKCLNCGQKRDGLCVISTDAPTINISQFDIIEKLVNSYMPIMQSHPERLICACDETHFGNMIFIGFRVECRKNEAKK
jgi:hypothetical protein